jgi:hypothetical protein
MISKITIFLLLPALVLVLITSCDNNDEPKTIPAVTTSLPSNIGITSATVGGNITSDGNDVVTKSGVVYSSNVMTPTTDDNKVELTTTTGVFTTDLTGLSSGTTYHVRAFATNSQGTAYGDVVDLTTGNSAPTATSVTITGITEVTKTLTAMYSYDDAENDVESGTTFQWYSSTSSSGADETAISGATSKTFLIQDAQSGQFLRVSVFPKAATGSINGTEVKSAYTTAIGAETVTFSYNGASVTYGTIRSAATGRKWLDRNIGATAAPESVSDYHAFGDLYQWGRLSDGHQLITRVGPNDADMSAVNGTTSTKSSTDVPGIGQFITGGTDWRSPQNDGLWQFSDQVNNPCPMGWRIPSRDEWNAEGISSLPDGFTKLKLTYTGRRSTKGALQLNTTNGAYWTSTTTLDPTAGSVSYGIQMDATTYTADIATRNFGFGCRCIKEQ